jgi:predicted site-specific integrase-resolvase
VVTYKDRLCRFGFELLEHIFKKADVKLVVLCGATEIDSTRELSDDLLAITTVFVARNNGLRSSAYRSERDQKKTQDPGGEIKGHSNLSKSRTETNLE